MTQRTVTTLACAFIVSTLGACGESPDRSSAAIDAIFAEIDDNGPGCAVGVAQDGELIHKAGYGMANVEHAVPYTAATPTRIASISKQFTAASILLLVEQGKVGLDSDIREYLPELPDYGHKVTVRHLMHHTSGLPSLDESIGFRAEKRPDFFNQYPAFFTDDYYVPYEFLPISAYLAGIASVTTLKFAPGTQQEYNNPGYFLLSQIVERVAGQTLREFAQENIFVPLGMQSTFFNDRVLEINPGSADAYLPLPDGKILRYNTDLNAVGDGSIFTTIEDFFLWDQNFYDNVLGSGSEFIVEQMTTPNDDAWYEPVFPDDDYYGGRYGFGLRIADTRGYRLEAHGGSWAGYRTQALRYPELGLSVYVFCNSALADTWSLSKAVAELYLPEEANPVDNSSNAVESWPTDEWEVSSPAAEEMDADALTKLDQEFRSGVHGNVDSMLVIRNGRIVFEANYPNQYASVGTTGADNPYNYLDANWHPYYRASDLHTMQSTTKSVMSALVGIAIARGDLPETGATLGELLPHRKIQDPEKAAITVENLLRMQSGFEWNEDTSYWDPENDATVAEAGDDWVAFLLAKPLIAKQGTVFRYNSVNTQMLSEIVSTATGMPLDDYADAHLFGPLGIGEYFWKTAPEGFKDVSGGLYLKPRDLARFALLYERDGEWNGTQILPPDWVRRSAAPYVPNTADNFPVGYGLQWWIYRHSNGAMPDMYGGWGWGGQFPLIVPELNLIAVFTGWNVFEGEDYAYAWELFYDRIVATTQAQ